MCCHVAVFWRFFRVFFRWFLRCFRCLHKPFQALYLAQGLLVIFPFTFLSFSLPEACLLCLFGWFYLQIVTWVTVVESNKSKSSTLGHALSSSPMFSLSFSLLFPLNASSVHPFSFRLPFMPIIGIVDSVFLFLFFYFHCPKLSRLCFLCS